MAKRQANISRRVGARIPAISPALIKAIEDGAITRSMAIFLTVLLDKEGYDQNGLRRVWGEVNDLALGITGKYVNVDDLIEVLRDEYGISV